MGFTLEPSLELRAAFQDLFATYAWGVDTGNAELLKQAFAEDGEMFDAVFTPGTHYRGHAELEKFLARFRDDPWFPGRQHWVAQTMYEKGPDGGWKARSMVIAPDCDGDPPYMLAFVGVYEDEFVETDAGWRFQRRKITLFQGDWLARLPHAANKAAESVKHGDPENYQLPGLKETAG